VRRHDAAFNEATCRLESEISNPKFRGRASCFWKQVRRDNHLGDRELMISVVAVITN
jgi:hypothetical protein